MKLKVLALLNALGLIVTLAINFLAIYLPLGGLTTAQISDKYYNQFTPANFTFAIWGFIYVLLVLFVIYMLVLAFGKKQKDQVVVERVGPWFILASIANSMWLLAWQYQQIGISVMLMLALLLSLIVIYTELRRKVPSLSGRTKGLVLFPISIYLGWISVATIANITVYLVSIGWNSWNLSPQLWVILMLLVGLILALAMIMRASDYGYALVILWAYLGIVVKRLSDSNNPDAGIITTAVLSIAVILIVLGLKLREGL